MPAGAGYDELSAGQHRLPTPAQGLHAAPVLGSAPEQETRRGECEREQQQEPEAETDAGTPRSGAAHYPSRLCSASCRMAASRSPPSFSARAKTSIFSRSSVVNVKYSSAETSVA